MEMFIKSELLAALEGTVKAAGESLAELKGIDAFCDVDIEDGLVVLSIGPAPFKSLFSEYVISPRKYSDSSVLITKSFPEQGYAVRAISRDTDDVRAIYPEEEANASAE